MIYSFKIDLDFVQNVHFVKCAHYLIENFEDSTSSQIKV